ncbi:MAG: sulfurtransferase [Anaerolineae bacterium]|nr:sulfurtransferase [Thermoflexales bacterium]MDW8408598.1 sulfurtransferase [Anaerolineae bacterium]
MKSNPPIQPLISVDELAHHLDDLSWLIVDCRFSLADASAGRRRYEDSHIPGAMYAHLNDDLSGPIIPGVTGRHPLPAVETAARTFGRLGIHSGVRVVAYDDMGGALGAARLWWMLRWLGHDAVQVLDGEWQAWLAGGYPTRAGVETRPPAAFIARPRAERIATAEDVETMRLNPSCRVLDARSAARFHGREETIDPVAGHIPGALSAPYTDNLTPQGTFRSATELRGYYLALLGDTPADQTVVYCGSGVSATHSILAMQVAGLGEARLYPGSWSEWITDPRRPVAS